MILKEIAQILRAKVLCGDHLDIDVHTACASDLMSDVLAFVKDQSILISGLVNPQTIRTAEMMDMKCVVFVRGKKPTAEIIDLAASLGIVVMASPLHMFCACSRLYAAGLSGGCDD